MRALEKLALLLHALPEPEETSGFLGTIDQLRCLRNISFRISSNGAADVFQLFQAMETSKLPGLQHLETNRNVFVA
jgi:hypothetical protein